MHEESVPGHAPSRVVVIADDFTGSNDAGVQLSKRGLKTVTLLDGGPGEGGISCQALVIDTESRHLSPEEAKKRVSEAAVFLPAPGEEALLYKKVDSLLRGNVGPEIGKLAELYSPDLIVFAPAYPGNRRTTKGGIHYLRGVPIAETEAAEDPLVPVVSSSVTEIAGRGNDLSFQLVEDPDSLLGPGAYCFDCETEEDLRRIVLKADSPGRRVLWCGSAGLAEALGAHYFGNSDKGSDCRSGQGGRNSGSTVEGRFFGVVGSMSGVNEKQIRTAVEYFARQNGPALEVVAVNIESLLNEPVKEKERVKKEAAGLFAKEKDVILSSSCDEGQRYLLEQVKAERAKGTGAPDLSLISKRLGEAAAEIIKFADLRGVYITGGETALYTVRALGVKAFTVEYEIEPGIPLIQTAGFGSKELGIVTKAGAFGSEEIIIKAVKEFSF